MTFFHTCRACVGDGACELQDAMKVSLAGLGVRSIKHRCTARVPLFNPGDPVSVKTVPTYELQDNGEREFQAPKLWFDGHFVKFVGNKPLVYVAKGTVAEEDDDWTFEPNGSGFLKVALSSVRRRSGEGVVIKSCDWCAAILSLGQPCGRDPNYTPSRSCLALTSGVIPTPAETGGDVSPSPTANSGES